MVHNMMFVIKILLLYVISSKIISDCPKSKFCTFREKCVPLMNKPYQESKLKFEKALSEVEDNYNACLKANGNLNIWSSTSKEDGRKIICQSIITDDDREQVKRYRNGNFQNQSFSEEGKTANNDPKSVDVLKIISGVFQAPESPRFQDKRITGLIFKSYGKKPS